MRDTVRLASARESRSTPPCRSTVTWTLELVTWTSTSSSPEPANAGDSASKRPSDSTTATSSPCSCCCFAPSRGRSLLGPAGRSPIPGKRKRGQCPRFNASSTRTGQRRDYTNLIYRGVLGCKTGWTAREKTNPDLSTSADDGQKVPIL